MHSFTLQESVFSTSSGASGFSYSESIPVKPDKIKRIKCSLSFSFNAKLTTPNGHEKLVFVLFP